MTDWEKQLGRRAQAVERAKRALDEDIGTARLDGHSFREIGRWADVNHERARGIAKAINGHTGTRPPVEDEAQSDTPETAELRWHYGPTDWAPDAGRMWHYDCPGGQGEVMYDGDGWAFCMGCKAVQAPDSAEAERPAASEETSG